MSGYPQNNATASMLASDKHFTSCILREAGVPALGGEHVFLHDRYRAHRPAGHERSDAVDCFKELGGSLSSSHSRIARRFRASIHGEAALIRYLDDVMKYYDAVLIQPIVEGTEYRVFLLDDDVLYCARKYPPSVTGDGVHTVRELLAVHNDDLRARGLSPASMPDHDPSLDAVPAKGERRDIPGRMNSSAGGTMVIADPPSGQAVILALQAARAIGLRVAAVDMFVDIGGKPDVIEIIEVNSNPSIRLLEDSNRAISS